MRRFINADVVAGNISNAVTLNRYAYANGNPVSNVDPFGLSADNKGMLDSEFLFNILDKMSDNPSNSLASLMLRSALDQILSFKSLFTMSNSLQMVIPVGNTTIRYSVVSKSGNGNLEISAVLSDQLNLAASLSFPLDENGAITVNKDGSIGIKYSYDIDKYNKLSASISAVPGISISAGYALITTDKYDNSMMTLMDITQYDFTNNKQEQIQEQTQKQTQFRYSYEQRVQTKAAIGWCLIAFALATDSFGFVFDDVLIPIGLYLAS